MQTASVTLASCSCLKEARGRLQRNSTRYAKQLPLPGNTTQARHAS
jgi:hypothetical protein